MNDATSQSGAARWRRAPAVVLAIFGLLLVSGCGGPFPQSAMRPAGEMAENLQNLFELIVWLAFGVFVLVEGALLVAIFRFRAKRQDAERDGQRLEGEPVFMHGNTLLELAWTLAPALVLVGVAVPTISTIWEVDRETRRPDALQIDVTAHQWWWQFEYPELGVVTANEVHVPVGRTVQFRLESADVIHSFWFPRQGGKRDVIPGKTNILWFRPDSVGRYPGQCAEFCGLSHALMKMEIIVETEEEFDAWVEGQLQPAPVLRQVDVEGEAAQARDIATAADTMAPERVVEGRDPVPTVDPGGAEEAAAGQAVPQDTTRAPQDTELARIVEEGSQLFMSKGCLACHRIQGTPAAGVLGPDLSHVGGRHTIAAGILENNRENMIRWIRDPMAVKPGAKMPKLDLTDEELQTLAAYLGSLE